MIVNLTDSNYKDILAQDLPVVIDFWAVWCGPCKMLSPVMDELAEQYDGKIIVAKANVDEAEELCQEYGIMSIPTILFFKNGVELNRHTGFAPIAKLQPLFEALL